MKVNQQVFRVISIESIWDEPEHAFDHITGNSIDVIGSEIRCDAKSNSFTTKKLQ